MEIKSATWLGAIGLVLLAGSCTDEGVMYLTRVSDETTGSNCTDGGQKLDFGADTDADGVLTTTEVTASTFVCNGAASRGASITNTPLVAGDANCLHGGFALTTGVDQNGNGVVDPNEGTTRFVCNSPPTSIGEPGPQGVPGNDGTDGADGDTPADGADGIPGATGATGADGADGADGATGPQGPPGADGPLGGPGAFCVDDAGCASDNCDTVDNECVQGTVANGAACTNDTQCASNDCDTVTANTCTAPPLAGIGLICTTNANCTSNNCAPSFIFFTCAQGVSADGEACTDDTQCANDCIVNECATPPLAGVGDTCAVDGDCTSGACDETLGVEECVQGSSANGTACTDDTQCLNDCITGLCATPLAGIGDTCAVDGDCTSGACDETLGVEECVQGTRATSAACTDDTQCASNDCDVGGTNQCAAPAPGPVSAVCATGADCISDNCVSNACAEGVRSAGAVCSDDTQCALDCDTIVTTQCTGSGVGASCGISAECFSESCVSGSCAQGTRGTGVSCSNNDQCASADCDTLDSTQCQAP